MAWFPPPWRWEFSLLHVSLPRKNDGDVLQQEAGRGFTVLSLGSCAMLKQLLPPCREKQVPRFGAGTSNRRAKVQQQPRAPLQESWEPLMALNVTCGVSKQKHHGGSPPRSIIYLPQTPISRPSSTYWTLPSNLLGVSLVVINEKPSYPIFYPH